MVKDHAGCGRAAVKAGDWAAAIAALGAALAEDPDDAGLHADLVRAHLAMRQPAVAHALATEAMTRFPDAAPVVAAWAAVCLDRGDAPAAEAAAARALDVDPGCAMARLVRAQVWAAAGNAGAALADLDRALADAPDLAAALAAKGAMLRRLGRLAEAERLLREALAQAPQSAEIEAALGAVQLDQGALDAAEGHLRRALDRNPARAESAVELGRLLERRGRDDDAAEAYRTALAADARSAAAHVNLGALLRRRHAFAAALEHLERGAALAPTLADAQLHLGLGRYEDGDRAGAIAALDRAAALDSGQERAHWARAVAELPILAGSEDELAAGRAGYDRALAGLEARYRDGPGRLAAAADGLAVTLPFYLPYQGGDDGPLQRRYGRLIAAAMAAGAPEIGPIEPPRRSRLRIGIVSAHFRAHSVWKILTAGWLEAFDRDRFELIAYPATSGGTSPVAALVDRVAAPAGGWRALARAIAADRCNALLYPEIGMDAATLQMAALRLAPVQMMAWGHPVTSGLPTIDAVLSSALMEPADGERQYTERLVRLPGLSIHYRPVADPDGPVLDLLQYGIGPGDPTYLCCQSLFKYRPAHDALLAAIAAGVPRARFLFIALPSERLTRRFEARLAAAFVAAGVDPRGRVVMLPRLSPADYAGLNRAADVYLDSLEWSGGNTTLEALGAGLPVVTLPGCRMRGRHSAAILAAIGLGDRVAATPDDYVARAVRLGRDPDARAAERATIRRALPLIYADCRPVRALEALLLAGARMDRRGR